MEKEIRIEGDYYDLLSYYANLYSIKNMGELDVHGFRILYKGHSTIMDTDTHATEFSRGFPSKEKGVDRVCEIYLDVEEINVPGNSFRCIISYDNVRFMGNGNMGLYNRFIERMDQSTFRFF